MAFNRIPVGTQAPEAPAPAKSAPFQPRHRVVTPDSSATVPPTATRVEKSSMNTFTKKFVMMTVGAVVVLGALTGGGLAFMTQSSPMTATPTETDESGSVPESTLQVGAVFGVPDIETFKDDTEGVLIVGGIDGEGSHTLLRPGGVSQNVYLTSSVVDLNQFANMRVRVWGETFKGQKAGWLMDVGRLEVKELSAELPDWYAQQQGE